MRKILLFLFLFSLSVPVQAESIHYYDNIYKLKNVNNIEKSDTVSNTYFQNGESENFWTSMFEVTYFSDINSPLKYASDVDKKLEADDKCILLKFIQNKKQNIALISYLESSNINEKTIFIYNVLKYEKHPKKGMLILKYSKKYNSDSKEDIIKMAKEVKENNNDYMERMIITQIPPIEEK